MLKELDALEQKIAKVASLCAVLRTENAQLRQQLAASEAVKRELEERVQTACTRLEQFAQQLPEAKSATA